MTARGWVLTAAIVGSAVGGCTTDPDPDPNLDVGWRGSGGMGISALDLSSKVSEVELRLDGKLAFRTTAGGVAESQAGAVFGEQSLASGSHMMTLRIVRQSVSPGEWYVTGSAQFVRIGTAEVVTVACPMGPQRITTGADVECRFSLP